MPKVIMDNWVKYVPLVLTIGSIISMTAVANAQLGELKRTVEHLSQYHTENVERRAVIEQRYAEMIRMIANLQMELTELRREIKQR